MEIRGQWSAWGPPTDKPTNCFVYKLCARELRIGRFLMFPLFREQENRLISVTSFVEGRWVRTELCYLQLFSRYSRKLVTFDWFRKSVIYIWNKEVALYIFKFRNNIICFLFHAKGACIHLKKYSRNRSNANFSRYLRNSWSGILTYTKMLFTPIGVSWKSISWNLSFLL